MATVTNKRKVLSVEGKVKAIRQIENWKNKSDFCRKFGLVNSTVETIWKNRPKLLVRLNRRGSRIKRYRRPERSDVDEALLKWFNPLAYTDVPETAGLARSINP